MLHKNKKHITRIVRSCITGEPVWYYQGPSENAARIAYWRACKHEVERIRNFPAYAKKKVDAVRKLLSDCLSEIPITAELTPKQKAAVKYLKSVADEGPSCHMAFYEHIMEERRRRAEDREIRRQMREREAAEKAAREAEKEKTK